MSIDYTKWSLDDLWKDASADEEMHGEAVFYAASELLRRGCKEQMLQRGWCPEWIHHLEFING